MRTHKKSGTLRTLLSQTPAPPDFAATTEHRLNHLSPRSPSLTLSHPSLTFYAAETSRRLIGGLS